MPKPQFNGDYSDTDSAATENETEYGEEPNLPLAPRVDDSGNDKTSIIRWSGLNKKFPLLHFSPHILLLALPVECKAEAEKFHLTYKFVKTECKLVRSILSVHCFKEVHPNSSNFNLMWTGSHLKPHTLRGLQDFQKINHFPRSYELTRKDKLYKNIQRMQHGKGAKHFDFIPESYVIPEEFNEFHAAFIKDRKPWIVKPVASSRGRGIYLINHPSQVPLDDNVMVCKYINNPLLVDGYKFDLRLYVGVTCFDPLRIYLYEEGLTRFATVKYDKTGKNLRNSCMHLTNYSVNKKNVDFVSCPDPEVEDYGNKWSMSAMLRFLKQIGKDTTALMMRIEDVVIKTIIAGELHIASACKMFMPYTGNCFEIYGFDILVDENLRPWLLEVNLSPSLACDSPLDLKIKSHLVSDMFNLVGFVAHDPMLRKPPTRRFVDYPVRSRYQRQRTASAGTVLTSSSRPASSVTRRKTDDTLTAEEARVLRHTREEFSRKGGFVRIFPSSDSWELYGSFLEHRTTLNHLLHSKLFPGRKTNFQRPSTACHTSASARTKSITLYGRSQSKNSLALEPSTEMRVCCGNETAKKVAEKLGPGITERLDCYERKLDTWSPSLLRTKALRSTTSSSGGVIAKQATSEISNQESAASRATPDGQVAVNNREESLTSHYPREPTKPQMEPDRRSAYKVSSTAPDQLYHRSFQENARAQKPPIPVSSATISKQVLSSQPRYQPIRVDDIMAKAGTLTKLQARQAFAMYLQRVQQRLNHETSYDSDDSRDSVDSKQDDQMNLVIRFLKKAASNLQQPFKVVVPSQKLRAHDRRRILAKQLGDFVHVYGKETAQLQKRQELNRSYGISRSILNTSEIPDEEFKVFMAIASEAELEDLLTTYTKLNKNASVFLGGRPDRTSQENTTKGPSVDASLSRRKESERLFRSSNPVPDESLLRPTEDLSTTGSNMMDRHARAFSAVSAYGTSVALNRTRQRPVSAKSSGTQGSERAHRACRPVSAKHTRDMSNVEHSSEESRGQDEAEVYSGQRSRVSSAPVSRDNNIENQPRGIRVSDEHAVAAALQRLAKRQAARQYSALNSSHQGNNWEHLFKKLDFNRENDGISHNEDEMIDVIDVTKNHVITSDSMSRDRPGTRPVLTHRHDRHASANATFETFVSYDKRPYMNGLNEGPVNWRNDTAEPHHSVSADARSLIHVDLKKEYNRTEESESVSRENGERRSPPVSRDEYNRQMRLISEKLSEEKLRLQQQLQQYPCLPRPPAARPSTRKMVAHKRMIRLAASNPPPVFDVISGMTGMIDDDPL